MAKRGYRGKHPHNDMKVNDVATNKVNPKLRVEYDKLKPKQKYSYIQSNYFYPQATMEISGALDFGSNQITMSAHNGTLLQIKGANATNTSTKTFKTNGTPAQAAEGIRDNVNTNMAGLITAATYGTPAGQVRLTMVEPGPDGHTAITVNSTLDNTVTFNGVASNNSASGFLFTGG